MQTTPPPGTGQVADALRKVYARPEFAPAHVNGFVKWISDTAQAVKDWFWGLVGGVLGRLHILQHSAPVVFWLLVGWMTVTAVAIAVHLVVTLVRALRARERETDERALAASSAPGSRPRTADAWEEEARRAAAEGRLRDAAVATYQALLLRLDARGRLRYDPAKTPGEYRREARRDPALAGAFGGFLRTFEPVAFGGRPLDGAGYQRLRDAAAEVARG